MPGHDLRADAAWRRSFVATSVLLGASVDDALEALEPGVMANATDIDVLAGKLRDPRRAVRATALAEVAREVVREIEELGLR